MKLYKRWKWRLYVFLNKRKLKELRDLFNGIVPDDTDIENPFKIKKPEQ